MEKYRVRHRMTKGFTRWHEVECWPDRLEKNLVEYIERHDLGDGDVIEVEGVGSYSVESEVVWHLKKL